MFMLYVVRFLLSQGANANARDMGPDSASAAKVAASMASLGVVPPPQLGTMGMGMDMGMRGSTHGAMQRATDMPPPRSLGHGSAAGQRGNARNGMRRQRRGQDAAVPRGKWQDLSGPQQAGDVKIF